MIMLHAIIKTRDRDHESSIPVPVKMEPMAHHRMGLQFTASGYGARIPMQYMVQVEGRWRRVYCCIYSNIGTLFIGRSISAGSIVDLWET